VAFAVAFGLLSQIVMPADLTSTNRFLGIIAVASALEMAAIVAVCIGIFLLTQRLTHLVKALEETQLAPAATRVHAILDDVREITSLTRGLFGRLPRRERE
jgi:hypothetical protein